ncbi:MAG: hypothetical protein NT069_10380 [Planctomycetota bacterium]|nr:hypothetical protein [Planctomycetota bacterium]
MFAEELAFAVETVRSAVKICRSVQGQIEVGKWDKGDRTPVTVADLAVQAVVSRGLHEQFPHDPLMGEEGSEELRSPEYADLAAQVTAHVRTVRADATDPGIVTDWVERGQHAIDPNRRYWVLDPVDGTKGFLRKEQYAIALALVERGKILLGVLACPNLPTVLGTGTGRRGCPPIAIACLHRVRTREAELGRTGGIERQEPRRDFTGRHSGRNHQRTIPD